MRRLPRVTAIAVVLLAIVLLTRILEWGPSEDSPASLPLASEDGVAGVERLGGYTPDQVGILHELSLEVEPVTFDVWIESCTASVGILDSAPPTHRRWRLATKISPRIATLEVVEILEVDEAWLPIPDQLPRSADTGLLRFTLGTRGQISQVEHPAGAGISGTRALLRVHVPAEYSRALTPSWVFDLDPLDTVRAWGVSGGDAVGAHPAKSQIERLQVAGQEVGLLDIEHFDPCAPDLQIARVYQGCFALAADGLPLAGTVSLVETSPGSSLPHIELEVRASISRSGSEVAPELLKHLEERAAQVRARLMEAVPSGGDMPLEGALDDPPRRPGRSLPIPVYTATGPQLLAALVRVREHARDRAYHYVLDEIRDRALEDPALRDRLFRLVESDEDQEIRRLALMTLGMTELGEVRLRFLEMAEELKGDASQALLIGAVFMRRSPGIDYIDGGLAPILEPGDDPDVLRRALDLSRKEVSPESFRALLRGLMKSQQVFSEGSDNDLSRRLREVAVTADDPQMREWALIGVAKFYSEENYDFLFVRARGFLQRLARIRVQ